nr:hypothetical protein [uncultured Aminipila sp.]
MCITKVAPEIKEKIIAIIVNEFKGIDDLPRKINTLLKISYLTWVNMNYMIYLL